MGTKTTRFAALVMVLSVICSGTAGCGKMTQEKLIEKMDEVIAGNPSTYAEISMDLNSSYKMGIMGMDVSMGLEVNMDMKSWVDMEPLASYSEGTMHINVMEQEFDSDIKTYLETADDGGITAYSYTGMTDEWVSSDSGMTIDEYKEMNAIAQRPMNERFSSITMEEETTELDGKEVYVLHLTCSGETIEAMMGEYIDNVFVSQGMNFDFSMDGLTAPAVYYVDTETFLPVQIEMTIDGMDNIVNDLIKQELGNMDEIPLETGEGIVEIIEEMDIAVEGTTCSMVMKNIGYGPQEVPAVPEEVKEAIAFTAALEELGTTLEDGSYVLHSGSTVLRVPMPAGWVEQGISEGSLSFANPEGTSMLTYTIIPEFYEGDYTSELVAFYDDLFTSMGMTLESGQLEQKLMTEFGEVDGQWTGTDGLIIAYTTVPIDSSDLYVLAMDMGGNWPDASKALTEAMDGVRMLTYEDIK